MRMETLPLTTSVNREYALRLAGVALLFAALTGWFLYDGAIGYPKENAAVAPIAAELAQANLPAADWMNGAKTGVAPLTEAFERRGLRVPGRISETFSSWLSASDPLATNPEAAAAVLTAPVHSEDDIRAQYISAVLGVLASLGLLGLLAFRLATRFELTEETLTVRVCGYSREWTLSELAAIDQSQWEKRGILKLRFPQGSVTLDAWHYAGIRPIVERLLARKAEA